MLFADGLLGLRGWQWLFLLEGIPTVAVGVWVWFTLAPAPLEARFLTPSEREWVHQHVKSHKARLVPVWRIEGDKLQCPWRRAF